MARSDLLTLTENGLFCEAGGFHIDPWRPVPRAVITHAHSDHARWGSEAYLAAAKGEEILRARLGDISLETLEYGERRAVGGVTVSLHSAGHVRGSAQVRVERGGEVWVVTGDYKTDADPVAGPFELVPCDTLISECTFGLPIYRWPEADGVFREIDAWWGENQEAGRSSILFGYSLGKAQRLLAGLDSSRGPILVHGAVHRMNQAHRDAGVALPDTMYADVEAARAHKGRCLVVAPPSAGGSSWIRKFAPVSTAFASGWMQVRGRRRRRAADRGFILSDHADWPGLLRTIEETGATRVGLTHGKTDPMVRYLREAGLDAWSIPTRFEGESEDAAVDADEDAGFDAHPREAPPAGEPTADVSAAAPPAVEDPLGGTEE